MKECGWYLGQAAWSGLVYCLDYSHTRPGGGDEILSTSMGTVTRYNVTCKLSLYLLSLSLSVNPDTLLQALLQLQ